MKRIKTAFRQAVKDKLIFGSAFAEVVAGDQSNDERKYFVTRDTITKVIETCRVFEIDMTACPQCGGSLTLIAAIEDPAVDVPPSNQPNSYLTNNIHEEPDSSRGWVLVFCIPPLNSHSLYSPNFVLCLSYS
jgi:hypothetical protein